MQLQAFAITARSCLNADAARVADRNQFAQSGGSSARACPHTVSSAVTDRWLMKLSSGRTVPVALAGFRDDDVAWPERFLVQAVVAFCDDPPMSCQHEQDLPAGMVMPVVSRPWGEVDDRGAVARPWRRGLAQPRRAGEMGAALPGGRITRANDSHARPPVTELCASREV
jgi:hypothetical protein